jgi:hypothetical protein
MPTVRLRFRGCGLSRGWGGSRAFPPKAAAGDGCWLFRRTLRAQDGVVVWWEVGEHLGVDGEGGRSGRAGYGIASVGEMQVREFRFFHFEFGAGRRFAMGGLSSSCDLGRNTFSPPEVGGRWIL